MNFAIIIIKVTVEAIFIAKPTWPVANSIKLVITVITKQFAVLTNLKDLVCLVCLSLTTKHSGFEKGVWVTVDYSKLAEFVKARVITVIIKLVANIGDVIAIATAIHSFAAGKVITSD